MSNILDILICLYLFTKLGFNASKSRRTPTEMKQEVAPNPVNRTIIIGAGMAGLAAAISLASKGEEVVVFERQAISGGKMRTITAGSHHIDSGPTVFTMKYVFDELFALAGTRLDDHVTLNQCETLARHAWDDSGFFDLSANRQETRHEIAQFFSPQDAKGYDRFCTDSAAIYNTLKDTFIGAQRPSPLGLSNRVGFWRIPQLLQLQPFTSLMERLNNYFPDQRLQQLFGRYATYVGSSPYMSPATLMLIAHVEQEGVWLVNGGMHRLAQAMANIAVSKGAKIRTDCGVRSIMTQNSHACGIVCDTGEMVTAKRIIYCGDASNLTPDVIDIREGIPKPVPPEKRSLSAITWSMEATVHNFPLHHHTVLFSPDYGAEFDAIFKHGRSPEKPTVYVCAQNRGDTANTTQKPESIFCLVNAPANGDRNRLSESELETCQHRMQTTLAHCGLNLTIHDQKITQPSDFETLFPGSGGALYGRAQHGWMASFARPGAKTKIPGLYLAGGSVHPGAGVPMATRSGMLAAEQIISDHALT